MVGDLTKKARWLRQEVLEMCAKAGVGHIASSFSCVEIIVALYYGGILRFDPTNPKWDERDRFLVSKGHGGIAVYSVLADLGFFPKSEIANFCCEDGILGSHPNASILGIEITSGSLGHGLGIGAGLAMSAKLDKKSFQTIVLLGDGELHEGSAWEAIMFAGHHRLGNLWAIVDRNMLSATDFTEKYLALEPLSLKWRAFGWDVKLINGHSFEEIIDAFEGIRQRKYQPCVVICETVKGKGISFMENVPLAHTSVLTGEMLEKAREELCN